MTTSICVLGYGSVARVLVKKLKSYDGYNNKFKVHCIHVRDADADKYRELTTIVQSEGHGDLRVLVDGTENTESMTPFSSDLEWLLDSQGHNIVVDCTSYNEDSVKLVFDLIKRGNKFHYMLPSKELVRNHWQELIELVKTNGGRISFNSIVAGDESEWSNIYMDQENFHLYAENPDLYSFRNGGPEEVSGAIYKDIMIQHAEELRRAREEELRLSCEPCGINDTFSWKDLD